jgi:hypothetical protein
MSLKNLQLPPSLLSDLYSNYLVENERTSKTKSSSEETQPKKILFLGGNAGNITIVVSDSSQRFMSDADLEWLQKMLLACKLSLGDVAIINTQTNSLPIGIIKDQLEPRKLLMLGPVPSDLQLPLHFPPFKIQEHDNCIYLAAPSPKELNQETQEGKILRTKLWVSLKKLFEV